VMLWDLLFRSQLGLSISFLEEMWARNLGQLFVTPLRPYEWLISLLAMSVIRVTIGVVPAALLAIPLYDYSIFAMGLPLVAFVVILAAMGWGLGLAICGASCATAWAPRASPGPSSSRSRHCPASITR